MKRQVGCFGVSVLVHAAIAIAAIAFCSFFYAEPKTTVIDLSYINNSPVIAAAVPKKVPKKYPATPQLLPASEIAQEVFPDTTGPDTSENVPRIPSLIATSKDIASSLSTPALVADNERDSANGQKNAYLLANYGAIRDRIYNRVSFPSEAIDMGWQGKVQLAFLVQMDGRVDSIRVLASSGYHVLDQSAIDAVKRAGPFPKSSQKVEIRLPISYRFE